jgi:hypothetical protein
MTLLGVLLMRYVTVRKASSQNIRGMGAFAKRERPTSTIYLCFLLADPFC